MVTVAVILFLLGYAAIVLEHPLRVDKTAIALLTAVLCWTALAVLPPPAELQGAVANEFATGHALAGPWQSYVVSSLQHHLEGAAEILFFLLGAMTIVELMDAHQAFGIITDRITTRNGRRLMWVLGVATFFLSALLDNLTTTIVVASLVRKLVAEARLRWLYGGMIVIAANAGGAFSPMGDVTTTMLWIGGQITAGPTLTHLFIPSLVCALVPMLVLQRMLPKALGPLPALAADPATHGRTCSRREQSIMLYVGLAALAFVPFFKVLTGLPPVFGMMLGLGIVWLVGEGLHRERPGEERRAFSAAAALSRADTSSVLFFFGILMAIGALEALHLLEHLAEALVASVGRLDVIAYLIGVASAVIDNVPLVAAAQGMFELNVYPTDSALWRYLAYAAGTGGSALIIGSAAGVAVMGIENITFGWYVKHIGGLALLGYTAGYLVLLALGG